MMNGQTWSQETLMQAVADGTVNAPPREDGKPQMVMVKALVRVRAGGVVYQVGETFAMELSLAAVHANVGQVEVVPASGGAKKKPSSGGDGTSGKGTSGKGASGGGA